MGVELLPDVLGALFPGPQVDLHEVHAGLIIQILQHVAGGDLVEIAVAKGGKRPDPDLLHQRHAVHLAELIEGQRQILQVGVDALHLLAARGDGIAVIPTLGDAAVAVDVVALVLGLQQLAEQLELLLHLQHPRILDDVDEGAGEGLDHVALGVLVVAVQLGTVVGDAAELLHVVHRVVAWHAHDGAHLIAPAVVMGRPALAAHAVLALQNGVVRVALLLQVHTGRQAGGASAHNTDANVLIHAYTSVKYVFAYLIRCYVLYTTLLNISLFFSCFIKLFE